MKASARWVLGLSIVGLAFVGYQGITRPEGSKVQASARMAPDFSLPHYMDGRSIRLSALKGKVVLVNFYETGCSHCQQEMGDFSRVYRELKPQGVEIVGISLDQDGLMDGSRQVSAVARQYKVTYPLVIGNDTVGDLYGGIDSVPMSFLVDREGRLVRSFPGAIDGAALKKAIAPLL